MKVQNSHGETIPLAKVAELAEVAALNAATTSEEILAATPDISKCRACGKKDTELDEAGKCPVCVRLANGLKRVRAAKIAEADALLAALPKETPEGVKASDIAFVKKVFENMENENLDAEFTVVQATDENLAKAEATLPKPEHRPSLEVETEVHDNLAPRIEAHLARMRAWDMRKLEPVLEQQFRSAMVGVGVAWASLGTALGELMVAGFVAKTTPVTRLASKLSIGAKVSLRDDQREIFAKVYSDEQLGSLSVVKVTDTHVQLMAEDGSNLGLVKIIHVVPKP